jgi:hypothetical protein
MKARVSLIAFTAMLAMCVVITSPQAKAQTAAGQHVVAQEELRRDVARISETRQANEAAIRHLLSSETAQQALKSAKVDYAKVDRAVSQLSDEEIARLASRARQAEQDFAAGFISAKTVAYIVLALVVIITLVVLIK